jgi:hypothetical protein
MTLRARFPPRSSWKWPMPSSWSAERMARCWPHSAGSCRRVNKAAAAAQTAPKLAGQPDARAMFLRSPSPLLRACFSAPRWLYYLGLGRLLGHRFMLLTHCGRRSGRTFQTVLEVVQYDPRTQESVVCSGWGTGGLVPKHHGEQADRDGDWRNALRESQLPCVRAGGELSDRGGLRAAPPGDGAPAGVPARARRTQARRRTPRPQPAPAYGGPCPRATGTSARMAAPEAKAVPSDKR